MTLDEVLTNFKSGAFTHEQARAWISIIILQAAQKAKLEALDKIEADIALLQLERRHIKKEAQNESRKERSGSYDERSGEGSDSERS